MGTVHRKVGRQSEKLASEGVVVFSRVGFSEREEIFASGDDVLDVCAGANRCGKALVFVIRGDLREVLERCELPCVVLGKQHPLVDAQVEVKTDQSESEPNRTPTGILTRPVQGRPRGAHSVRLKTTGG